MGRGRTMEWAARANHMGGIPRKAIILAAGAFARAVANLLNSTTVHNPETLIRLVRSRPPGVPLLTVSNHMSTSVNGNGIHFSVITSDRLDDPVMWGFKGFPTMDANLARWVLAAEDICFKNRVLSYCFRLGIHSFAPERVQFAGKCIPITRGGGIYQEHMNEALERLSDGAWLHTFPEGKVSQENEPIRRLKWGTASLIARAPVTPIVLPIVHHGFQEVMPEKYLFGRRPPFPLFNKKITITVGDPIEFDLPKMSEMAVSMSKDCSSSSSGWPCATRFGLNEAAQKCLYSSISKQIWVVMENLRNLGKTFLKQDD
ncbi:hypothetical protein C3L33_01792, partial [Rhododendron williamsianum]